MRPADDGPRKMRRHAQGSPSRRTKPKGWRITLAPEPGQDRNFPVVLDKLVLEVTIADGSSPQELADWTLVHLRVSRHMRTTSIEPIGGEPWVSRAAGVTREEIAELAEFLGYGDMLKKDWKTSGKG